MHLEETSFDINGVIYYKRVWRYNSNLWTKVFRWDDLESAAYIPIEEDDIYGTLQLSKGF